MSGTSPRMTLPTQLVLRALLEDPGAERYGLEIGDTAGLPSGTIHPILARLERLGLGGVAVGGRRPQRGRPSRPPLLPTHDGRRRPGPRRPRSRLPPPVRRGPSPTRDGLTMKPTPVALGLVRLSTRLLPAGDLRQRYRWELYADLSSLDRSHQLAYASGVFSTAWQLRRELTQEIDPMNDTTDHRASRCCAGSTSGTTGTT